MEGYQVCPDQSRWSGPVTSPQPSTLAEALDPARRLLAAVAKVKSDEPEVLLSGKAKCLREVLNQAAARNTREDVVDAGDAVVKEVIWRRPLRCVDDETAVARAVDVLPRGA